LLLNVARTLQAQNPHTLVTLLREQAERDGSRTIMRFLGDSDAATDTITYAELDARARAIATHLQLAAAPGERALVLHPPGLDYIAALFGCFYAGVIAVPAYPPRLNRSLDRLQDIIEDARPRLALTTASVLARLQRNESTDTELSALQWIATDHLTNAAANHWQPLNQSTDDIALLQYTSGSTSTPKGVMLSHANLINNIRGLAALRHTSSDDRFVSWLPPYHDMGLIGATLLPLYMGTEAVLLAPTAFLQRPLRWLEALSQYRGTISGGPNFAYELCVRRISEAQKQTLDLSAWQVAFCGAERVRAETLERFAAAFASCGFQRRAFTPCYGLAEATLAVSFSKVDADITSLAVDPVELSKGSATTAVAKPRVLAGCGQPLTDTQIIIVDPERQERLVEGAIGEIWVHSPSIACGYWNKPELSEQVFRARLSDSAGHTYLRTGDLGFIRGDELFVTGRIKDLIVIRGLNYYPEDIETSVDRAHARLRAGCGVAFSVDRDDEEQLIVVYEVDSSRELPATEVIAEIRSAVADAHQLQAHDVLLVPPGSVPKTSSGKLQRSLSRQLYLEGGFTVWGSAGQPANAAEPENTELTAKIARLMSDVLGVEHIKSTDDFFWLGGHSLMATQLASRIRDVLGVELPLRTIFAAPTPRLLAAAVTQAAASPHRGPVERVPRNGQLALSFSQERMWLLHQLDPNSAAYNVAGAVSIDGRLDAVALKAALKEVLARHEVLRTNYGNDEGRPALKIVPRADIRLECVDLRDRKNPQAAATALASELSSQPFDIATELLVRGALYQTADDSHVLCISMHHLVTDAWSMGVFARELLRYYDAFASGVAVVHDTPAIEYVDYAHWQRTHFDDSLLQPSLSYWQKQLAGAEALELPSDRPRAAIRSARGAFEPLPISSEAFEAVSQLAKAEGTTPFTVLLAAFHVLLHRYTQRTDVVVGVPVANRNWLAAESLMGTLVNTLPVRLRFDADVNFRQLLRELREVALDAYAHQDLPFERLVAALGLERRAGESPLIRVMFDYQNTPMPEGTHGALQLQPLMISRGAAQFDLSFMVLDTKLGRIAGAEYSTDLFDADTIRRLLRHYAAILEAAVANPAGAIAQIPLLSDEERQALIRLSRATCDLGSAAADVYATFLEQVRRSPDAPAVHDRNGKSSYAELDHRVELLAARLQGAGITPSDRVAIFMDRSRDMVAAVLACLRVGAPYVPLDPRHPTERIRYVLNDAQVRAVLTDTRLRRQIASSAFVICVDETHVSTKVTRDVSVSPEHAAYVIYTSGSTGKPKGVEVSRGALANFLRSMRHTPGIDASSRLLAITTLAFDIAGLELLLPVTSGASVYVADSDVAADAQRLSDIYRDYRPTIMQATPALWNMLLDAGWQGDSELSILCGGEALKPELAGRLLSCCRTLWNMYGPTETTIWSTVHRVTGGERTAIPIGKPIDETSIYILDKHGELVPRGVSGEIYIGGAGVATGYLHRPELTRERFLPDRLGGTGARMYRTGDAGRRRNDGTLEYLGRLDQQIKLRGFRIEPGEIEQVMKEQPSVRDALVMAREDSPGDMRLVAYYLPADRNASAATLQHELAEALQRKLPSYMVPSAFVALDAFPQTPNGKIDRAALPAPTIQGGNDGVPYVAPRNEIEVALQRIWQTVLGVDRIGIRDDFFKLGGHSLLAVRVFAAIERELHIALPLATLFERATIEYLAERINATHREKSPPALPPIRVSADSREFSFIVPVREQGSRPPLFCVHGAGGQVLNFWPIAQYLGDEQPFYALQAAGIDGKQQPLEHIETMAERYLAEMRRVQPRGPYYLAGYCGGGWIAFEIAQRLRAQGEHVAMLALLDSYGPRMPMQPRPPRRWLGIVTLNGAKELYARACARVRRDFDALSQTVVIACNRALGRPVPYELRDAWLTRCFLKTAARYHPRPYDGFLTLLLAKDSFANLPSHPADFGWQGLARGIEVDAIPGTHHTLTSEPNVSVLVDALRRRMRASEQSKYRR